MTTIESIFTRLTKAVGGTDKELYTEEELTKFATFYLDKWDENTSEDVIAESFTDYLWDTDRTGIEQGECSNEEMMNFINEYEYENGEIYFYIYPFTFE